MRHRVFYDNSVHVRRTMCSTCIGRPGNLMHLERGRVEGMLEDIEREQSCIPCHQTLEGSVQAVCRWQFNEHPTQPLQLAQRLGLITFVS